MSNWYKQNEEEEGGGVKEGPKLELKKKPRLSTVLRKEEQRALEPSATTGDSLLKAWVWC